MIEMLEVFLLFALRLGIPLLLTYLLGKYLQGLDEKWRKEGLKHMEEARQIRRDHPGIRCWEIRNCTPEVRAACPAYLGKSACWEIFRSNGQLNGKCVGCEVMKQAPAPVGI